MTTSISAIETTYAGHRFRSRLEARWAVFFDALRIEWRYEEQGYATNAGPYLPDFRLPNLKAFVEVKGDDENLARDADRLSAFTAAQTDHGLLVLGPLPHHVNDQMGAVPVHWCVAPGKTLDNADAIFWACRPRSTTLDESRRHFFAALRGFGHGATTQPLALHGVKPVRVIRDAYVRASTARFEHGETPRSTAALRWCGRCSVDKHEKCLDRHLLGAERARREDITCGCRCHTADLETVR